MHEREKGLQIFYMAAFVVAIVGQVAQYFITLKDLSFNPTANKVISCFMLVLFLFLERKRRQ